jgi:hypothetical protein
MLTHYATKDLGDQERDNRLGSKKDSGKGDDKSEAGHDGISIAKTFGDIAVDEKADDLADVGALGVC